MGWGDYGKTPNVYRPAEVPVPFAGDDMGVGPAPIGGSGGPVTRITEEQLTTFTSAGWTLLLDETTVASTTSATYSVFREVPIPAYASHALIQIRWLLPVNEGVNIRVTNKNGAQVFEQNVGGGAGAATAKTVILLSFLGPVSGSSENFAVIHGEVAFSHDGRATSGTATPNSASSGPTPSEDVGVALYESFVGLTIPTQLRFKSVGGGTVTVDRLIVHVNAPILTPA